jgi:hypothetical protein
LDATPATTAKTEVETLWRFLELSQTALEAAKREMQVIRDQQVVADSRVAGEFFVRYFRLNGLH